MSGIIEGLLAAWILNLFGFGELFIKGMNEWSDLDITTAGYYVFFALVGLLFEGIGQVRGRKNA
jgi:hypothetical protein